MIDEANRRKIPQAVWVLTATLVVIVIVCGLLIARNGELEIRIAFAEDQVRLFQTLVEKSATQKSQKEVQELIDYAVWYYPSGTKQTEGSRLDFVVETARSNAIQSLQLRLHSLTNLQTADSDFSRKATK